MWAVYNITKAIMKEETVDSSPNTNSESPSASLLSAMREKNHQWFLDNKHLISIKNIVISYFAFFGK
jgi:hypothetical protein